MSGQAKGDVAYDMELTSGTDKKTTKKESSLRIRDFIEKNHEPLAEPVQHERKVRNCCIVS